MNQAARAKLDSVDLWNDVASQTWRVTLPNGTTRAMTIEELDAAFERSEVGLHTLVQRPSGGEWRTLGEAAGVDDSIRPFSTDDELVDIPRPPPMPKHILAAEDGPLTTEELASVNGRKTGRRLASVAVLGLLAGGFCAWRYMPATPIPLLATATITALVPKVEPVVAPPAAAALPTPLPPETSPAPEGNALADTIAKVPPPVKAAKAAKAKANAKTTWKQRMKAHSAKTVSFKKRA